MGHTLHDPFFDIGQKFRKIRIFSWLQKKIFQYILYIPHPGEIFLGMLIFFPFEPI